MGLDSDSDCVAEIFPSGTSGLDLGTCVSSRALAVTVTFSPAFGGGGCSGLF